VQSKVDIITACETDDAHPLAAILIAVIATTYLKATTCAI
jgi:hypothetical protein